MSHLISPDELHARLADGAPVTLLDVRWRLDLPEGRPEYVSGHLPGAVYVDLEAELSRRGHPEDGRHPLPLHADLQRAVTRWGVDEGDLVVVYDDNDSVAAARAWWLLRRSGLHVCVLDGGLRGWIAAGHLLRAGDVAPRAGTAALREEDPGDLSIEEAAAFPTQGVLIDVRTPERYRGTSAGYDPAAGHIPGAVNLPAVTHIAADGRLRDGEEVRRAFARVGATEDTPIALYCASGIASAHSALALAVAGLDAKVFSGSWSRWTQSAGRPVAVGASPAERVFGH
ncbi:sulfurtransferase [Microbacterium betulae]|uniref:Sulfurtransferase n=1 Tax=Microbacterium betulae TaxID=2981139 RepID=A0AA97FJI4_9MICO|nr:sulfurtransferase [Microbacterium sp. AB]WOF23199.1 sulfurtransferase [Microbacterium sp. AB]